jgi:hypothetical protein
VTLTLKEGSALPAIKIGKTTQVGFSAYAQKGDDPKVYLTAAALQSGIKKQVKDLRDKTLIAFEDTEVRKFELARDAGTLTVEREGETDKWTITAPARHPADSAEVRALLASLRGIRADDFVSDDANVASPYRLARPRLKVACGSARRPRRPSCRGLREQQKSIYAKRAELPAVVTLPDFAIKNLDKRLSTLRDKTVLGFAKDQAATLAVTRKDGNGFTLVKRDGGWHVEEPGEGVERAPTITRSSTTRRLKVARLSTRSRISVRPHVARLCGGRAGCRRRRAPERSSPRVCRLRKGGEASPHRCCRRHRRLWRQALRLRPRRRECKFPQAVATPVPMGSRPCCGGAG